MNLIEGVSFKNFRCFRAETKFDFSKSTYFVGINNAGKSAILSGVRFFFDEDLFKDDSFLNSTEFSRKQEGSNKCEISLTFNLNALKSGALRKKIIRDAFGQKSKESRITIKKNIILSKSGNISTDYQVENFGAMEFNTLPKEILKLIASVSINYLHPQEGRMLLKNAQEKLRIRLLQNWGRGAALSQTIEGAEIKWSELNKLATLYLSRSLTESTQKMWPNSKVSISLPQSIKDLIGISSISFQASNDSPEISLTNQGAGAQSTILYHTHFLLDSDTTLHRGEYHPVWLVEEPESFLHTNLAVELGQELNSKEWLRNIQMLITTHSPVLLATARRENEEIRCTIIEDFKTKTSKLIKDFTDEEINDVGKLMGDDNFYAYFNVSFPGNKAIFIEDERIETKESFERSGFSVSKGLMGVPEIAKYLAVILSNSQLTKALTYFIVDGDNGSAQLQKYLDQSELVAGKEGFRKFRLKVAPNVFIILLPIGSAVEDLFSEYSVHVDSCIGKLWNSGSSEWCTSVPRDLVRTGAMLKSKKILPQNCEDQIRTLIKNEQEIKDLFWGKVSINKWQFSKEFTSALSKLLK